MDERGRGVILMVAQDFNDRLLCTILRDILPKHLPRGGRALVGSAHRILVKFPSYMHAPQVDTTIPMMPAFVHDVINRHGNVVTVVIDLAQYFGRTATELRTRYQYRAHGSRRR